MSRSGWLALIAAAGLGVATLSFVDAWIIHDRELNGEGYRDVLTTVDAWRSVAFPVVTLGVVAAAATAAAALLRMRRPELLAAWVLPAGSVLALALLGSILVPISQDGHASKIDLRPGWAAPVGMLLAALMLTASVWLLRPRRAHALALLAMGVLLLPAAAGGRWVGLQARAGSNEAWSDGSYTRPATGGEPTETLVIEDGRFRIGDRWAGTWESSGWTVMLDDDPACPGSRGAYHAHGAPAALDENLRFVKIVDTCQGGARAADLETGIWVRNP